MSTLILVRHGLSKWNLTNKFSGWVDIPLADQGIKEAQKCAEELKDFQIDLAFTSELTRAQQTLLIILSKQHKTGIFIHNKKREGDWYDMSSKYDKEEIPIISTEILNERYYGVLQGMDKDDARKKYGEKQVLAWRRGYKEKPPKGESLEDVYNRVLPFFTKKICPKLRDNNNILIVAHGNTIRAILKFIEKYNETDIVNLEIPTAKPIIYKYDHKKFNKLKYLIDFNRKVYWEKPS